LGVVWSGVFILLLVEGIEGGDTFFSPILPIVDPADGGEPPEVSALGGCVDVSAAGGCVDVSAAKTDAIPMDSARTVNARRRVISSVLSVPHPNNLHTQRFEVSLFPTTNSESASKGLTLFTCTTRTWHQIRTRFCVQSEFASWHPLRFGQATFACPLSSFLSG
jgi:hypothetical protein